MNDLYDSMIVDGFKKLAGKYAPDIIIPVNVLSVDTDNYTCVCEDDLGVEIQNVFYKSTTTGDEDIVFEPAINSRIYIGRISTSYDWALVKPGRCNKIFFGADVEIVFNAGTSGGMVLRDGLKAQLNKLENDLNNLKNALTAYVPTGTGDGAALKLALAAYIAATLTATVNADIENTAIKQ